MVKEEVILVPGKPESVFKGGKLDGEFTKYVYKWDIAPPGTSIMRARDKDFDFIHFCYVFKPWLYQSPSIINSLRNCRNVPLCRIVWKFY